MGLTQSELGACKSQYCISARSHSMCESVTCILLLQFIFPDNGALWYFLLLSDVFEPQILMAQSNLTPIFKPVYDFSIPLTNIGLIEQSFAPA